MLSTVKPWSNEDLAILREEYSKKGYNIQAIATLLGRSFSSVSMKAYFLGITQKWPRKKSFSYNVWIPNEVEMMYLNKYSKTKSFAQMAHELGKSEPTISRVCKRLGLGQKFIYTPPRVIVHNPNEVKNVRNEKEPTVKREIEVENKSSGENRIREAMERLRI